MSSSTRAHTWGNRNANSELCASVWAAWDICQCHGQALEQTVLLTAGRRRSVWTVLITVSGRLAAASQTQMAALTPSKLLELAGILWIYLVLAHFMACALTRQGLLEFCSAVTPSWLLGFGSWHAGAGFVSWYRQKFVASISRHLNGFHLKGLTREIDHSRAE